MILPIMYWYYLYNDFTIYSSLLEHLVWDSFECLCKEWRCESMSSLKELGRILHVSELTYHHKYLSHFSMLLYAKVQKCKSAKVQMCKCAKVQKPSAMCAMCTMCTMCAMCIFFCHHYHYMYLLVHNSARIGLVGWGGFWNLSWLYCFFMSQGSRQQAKEGTTTTCHRLIFSLCTMVGCPAQEMTIF